MILDCLIFNIVFSGFTKFSVQKWYEMYSTKSENLWNYKILAAKNTTETSSCK